MKLLKLVIVDDEPILLQGLVKTYNWNEMGFEVAGQAQSGEQAIEVIKKVKPHVVLTDIRMKQVSGLMVMEEIQKTAALMRFELERGNVDGFAKLLDYHWELSKKIDAGSSNTLIEQIFSSIEELVDGKLVCGAGGGGFLQVILKKGVTRQMVEERLKEVFMDSLVGVADCKLVWE